MKNTNLTLIKSKRYGAAASLVFVSTIVACALVAILAEQDSAAMITDLFGGPPSKGKRFRQALEHLGHEKPRPFRLDGNVVYIAVRHSRKSPKQLLGDYQREFQSSFINDRVITNLRAIHELENLTKKPLTDEGRQELSNAFNGGLIPVEITPKYVRLVGAEPIVDINLNDPVEAMKVPPEKLFKAVRTIEIVAVDSGGSDVIATFADDLDGVGSRKKGTSANDDVVPSPPKGRLINELEDLDPDVDFVGRIYSTNNCAAAVRFYKEYYLSRGWTLDKGGVDDGSKGESMEKLIRNPADGEYNLRFLRGKDEYVDVSVMYKGEVIGKGRGVAWNRVPNSEGLINVRYAKEAQ